MPRPSQFSIDLDALAHNVDALSRLAGSRQKMAVVKANAYGHGAVACAQALEMSVDAFAVAITEEAIELRDAGIDKPILVLQGPHSSDDLDIISAHSLWPAVSNHHQLTWLIAQTNKPDQVWLKVDTGMHRLGFDPSDLFDVRAALCAAGIRNTTLMSHLADAEDAESDLTHRQAARWDEVLKVQNDWVEGDKQASFSNSARHGGRTSPPRIMGTTRLFTLRRLPDRPASRIAATPRYDIHLESGGDTLDRAWRNRRIRRKMDGPQT